MLSPTTCGSRVPASPRSNDGDPTGGGGGDVVSGNGGGAAGARSTRIWRRQTTAPGGVQAIIAPHAGLMFSGPVARLRLQGGGVGGVRRRGARRAVAFRRLRGGRGLAGRRVRVVRWGLSTSMPTGAAHCSRRPSSAACRRPMSVSTRSRCSCRSWRASSRRCRSCRCSSAISGATTIEALAEALAAAFAGRRALLVASTDLSHYFDAARARDARRRGRGARRRVRRRRPARPASRGIRKTSAAAPSPAAAAPRSR